MPRSMIPFLYSPWPFLDLGQDPDPNGTPPTPNVPGVTIPWSALPPIAPPPLPASPPVVPPPNIPPPPQPTLPPSDTPGLDKAIARMNAPTPGFHLTPGLGGFSQRAADAAWSLPPPPQLLPMPPMGGGLAALGSILPPMAPAHAPSLPPSDLPGFDKTPAIPSFRLLPEMRSVSQPEPAYEPINSVADVGNVQQALLPDSGGDRKNEKCLLMPGSQQFGFCLYVCPSGGVKRLERGSFGCQPWIFRHHGFDP